VVSESSTINIRKVVIIAAPSMSQRQRGRVEPRCGSSPVPIKPQVTAHDHRDYRVLIFTTN
jgi:hypothetical protein